ncbi:C-type lectin domain family 4 member E-like [Strongylocentrotus purpuratus]|uniref:C-type lectin domain-containing protein n=1 Tax=Strongylocentrotus purpuratus TaxID=7668 RepID=A0A7M7NPI2_STRPU|nr:C-type lectin domain family 4 member E-like [Strongylocentrotus purpuratus]XP_030839650.1 C-type lectin domain family 4 member E-like [Strongylocentrotus purpuratus]
MTKRSDTTTSQNTTTSESVTAKTRTKSEPSTTATMTERSDATTSQATPTSKSVESSTTDATTKATTSSRTTVSDTTKSQETTPSACSSSPMEYEFGGSFYNFSTCKIDQASAVLACSQYGSHLVFIESQEEEDFIARSLQHRWDYWIGLTGSSLSEAKWLDGSNLTYSNFESESFNDNGNCFRIMVWYQNVADRLDLWQDKDCSIQLRFICEKEVGI